MGKNYVRNIFKIGGSLGVTLPQKYCIENVLSHGTKVYMEVNENRLLIEVLNPDNFRRAIENAPPKKERPNYTSPHVIDKNINNQKHQQQQKGKVKWQQKNNN